uniref:Aminotransferase-like plant mobile domain-containing protein n=1 Tax=Phaseolus vulgaris TaxID=3885 RepID=V7CKZ7_PHAVU|nr:hypothetical protein PHAVU_002G118600g [Phaseolus vulgaris]ESW30028.1 hypothetical protein PHAVU_002G118600g [Phaseolus vulgaris]
MQVFRHYCRPKFLGSLNKTLSAEEKFIIESTPFGWLIVLDGKLKLSRCLLRELCSRWVERSHGFVVSSRVVPFSLLDVCLGIGLRVVGDKFDLEKIENNCKSRSFFKSSHVTVKMIYDEIVKRRNECSIDDFCRLYILLGMSEFLFPSRMGLVPGGLFRVVDDLGELGRFNWGGLVYDFLVQSLCSASMCMRRKTNATYIHVRGLCT